MTKTANKRTCILFLASLLFGILGRSTEAALTPHHQQQQQPYRNQQHQSYTQNLLDEPNRSKADTKDNSNVIYDHVDDLGNRVLDRFDHRFPDGSYEYRYELSDGTSRYERGYFVRYDKKKELVVVGYYSYRMPTGQFYTVFYNADRYGYRQNNSITRDAYPNLPRSIEVPETRDDAVDTTTLKPFYTASTTTTKRGPY